jgi:signal transduction histidine kinase/ActR/RegA family two-component response regulator
MGIPRNQNSILNLRDFRNIVHYDDQDATIKELLSADTNLKTWNFRTRQDDDALLTLSISSYNEVIIGSIRNAQDSKWVTDALRELVSVTSSLYGEDFFKEVCCRISKICDVRLVALAELVEQKTRVKMFAFLDQGSPQPLREYDLEGTPCSAVVNLGKTIFHPRNVQAVFPDDLSLQEYNIQGYLGVPLKNSKGEVFGALLVLDDKPLDRIQDLRSILNMLAIRIGAERERYNLDCQYKQMANDAIQSQRLESLGLLAGGIAHDFNNFLGIMLGNLNLAQVNVKNEEHALKYLTRLEKGIQKASELTQQMLAYTGKSTPKMEAISVNCLVQDMMELIQASISKRLSLKQNLGVMLPEVLGDKTQLQQVVMNLILNAADAFEDKEGVIEVTTMVKEFSSEGIAPIFGIPNAAVPYMMIEVKDEGKGITPEVLDRIFDPFYTTKQTGRGLGLSAASGIVKAHNGFMKVHSIPGGGSTFRVFLPLKTPQNMELPLRGPDDCQTLKKFRGRLLLVEDETALAEAIINMVRKLGLEVYWAHDGKEALYAYEDSGPYSLVLMDLIMPRLNGVETFEELRIRHSKASVVLMSGYNITDSLDVLVKKGLKGFLQKPFGIKDLVQVLESHLSKHVQDGGVH